MPVIGPPVPKVHLSAVAELAWVGGLLAGGPAYCRPALEELDRGGLAPGIAAHLGPFSTAYRELFPEDDQAGCVEVLWLGHRARALDGDAVDRLLARWRLACRPGAAGLRLALEAPADRQAVLARLQRLTVRPEVAAGYRDWLAAAWELIRQPWEERGRVAAEAATLALERRFEAGESLRAVLAPRHPLAAALRSNTPPAALLEASEVVVSPLYFCLSGGHVIDLPLLVHVGLPANALAPFRKGTDGAYVAHLARVLAEPARVTVLIDLLARRSTVMELSRRLQLPQPTISTHLQRLVEAGLVMPVRADGRTQYLADRRRVDGLLDDIRAVLERWVPEGSD